MALRRGFKSEANWYANEMRRELKLAPHSPLCPWTLAKALEFAVVPLSAYAALQAKAVSYFRSDKGSREFSAVTLFGDDCAFIIHNDGHHIKRQAANIAHEIAHGLLLHPPMPPFSDQGSRHYNQEFEDEANWLGPALLVSDEAALFIVERKMSLSEASDQFRVSQEVVRMRINVSGAAIRVSRRRAA